MWIIKPATLRAFWNANKGSEAELKKWLKTAKEAEWRHPPDVKADFGVRVDFVRVESGNTVAVFDVTNNKWRLIAAIHYDRQRVFVLRILTHEEYDHQQMEARIMNKTATLPKRMPRTFGELNALLPLRPINDKIELENAYEVVDRLAVLNRPTKDQQDYLDTLVLLTEVFDKEANEAALAAADKVSGRNLLKYLMSNTQMTQAALAKLLAVSEGAVSMILKGTRSITAEHARALGKYFAINPGAFIR